MWTCHRQAVADDGLELRLLGAFRRAHQRAGAPPDAAIFRCKLGARGAAFYFSPAATEVAVAAMSEMGLRGGPVSCERPESVDAQLYGPPDAKTRLLGG